MKRDLYQTVTDKIVAQMEAGTLPWVKDWSVGGSSIPMNAVTERPYSCINMLLFWIASQDGYAKARYLTFKQALEAGGNVRKGEHGTKVSTSLLLLRASRAFAARICLFARRSRAAATCSH
jgi:antirestriction protein ArdC